MEKELGEKTEIEHSSVKLNFALSWRKLCKAVMLKSIIHTLKIFLYIVI